MTGLSEQQLAEIERLRERVAELETFAYGCDAEGCVIPHSSWCEAAKKTAAENDGCTCGRPWQGHPQPHAMYCWVVNPPRNEVEEMRKRIAELLAERHDTNEALSDAAEAIRAKDDRIAELEQQRDRRRGRLVALQNDRMETQGLLSPNDGTPRRVPPEIEIHERVAPAVAWLIGRVAELEQQRDTVRGEVAEAVMCPDAECLNRHHLPKIVGLLGGVGLVDAPEAGESRG